MKTVNYKGRKIKVEFSAKFPKVMGNVSNGTFCINGKEYPVSRKTIPIVCQNGSKGYRWELTFNGFTIPENDKKMIEHIINQSVNLQH